ncbi:MAG: efflux RND transporter periplasmic adaptor subunit [Nitrospira sp.]|nr:efflux RND transporter periplasmic adaptor subunit [Nitrospira sp.]MDH4303810.1 efflux RND transporter periplasmic adaptor subunit [Nitrospira sp.]MDH5193453.1 efflux RND transporter periplasmic adaptor subunit [Nitrospira sp.]
MIYSWKFLAPGSAGWLVVSVAVFLSSVSCQPAQDEAQKRPQQATPSATQAGVIELPEGSSLLAQIQTERVGHRSMRMSLKAQGGKILPNENRLAHLGPRVPGRIVAVYANLGDRVQSGERLLLLDSPAFGEAQLDYRKRRTAMRVAEKAFERAKALSAEGAIGVSEYQRREAEHENAKAELYAAEEKLHLLGMAEREIERLSTEQLPHAEVAQVFLRAPFSGEIIERNATVGEVVDSSKTLFTVADLSTVWVRADFPEQQIGKLNTGLAVEVRVAAYSDTVFQGAITYIGAMIDPATRTITARSQIPNSDRRLRPEMFAEVTVRTQEQSVLAIPRAALQQVGSRTMVFVIRGSRRFEFADVTIGESSNDYVEIKAGLKEGEEVVTEGSYALKSEALRGQMSMGGPL